MTTQETSRFKQEDLVLKVTGDIDPGVFDISKYEAFIETLCSKREYQAEAIRTGANYLFGGAYRDLRALADENFKSNPNLREKYGDPKDFEGTLEFPDQLACTLDLATGTGKSFVMYGLARIALAEGKVDRVLLLCPSKTIESGLTQKFRDLSKDRALTTQLPKKSRFKVPHVVNATETAVPGDICIENIHAVYANTKKNSIAMSFKGKGDRTLVLCDEAHHILSPEGDSDLKKWKEFLLSPEYGFRYIVGLSGTCYIGDEYFRDVVSRYSLRQAIKDGVVKDVWYVHEDTSVDDYQKFQKIYDNHKKAKAEYRAVKPLTVIVTKDIPACKKLEDDLVSFLSKHERISKEAAAKKVLRVHTRRSSGQGAKEDKAIASNVERLRTGEPDRKTSPVEWIVSVSMLTEGWDAHNVFQIVPHELRAFNSRLLVAQVLGRGLRIPKEYLGQKVEVKVFNHDRWSSQIKHLVDEVIEEEKKVSCWPIARNPKYDFTIHNLDYDRAKQVVPTKQRSEYNFTMKYVSLATQRRVLQQETTYEEAITANRTTKSTKVQLSMIPLDQVVNDIHNKFRAIDDESGSRYAERYTKDMIRALVKESLKKIKYKGDEVSRENRQRILSAFGNLKRPGSKSIRYKITESSLVTMKASERPRDYISVGTIKRGDGACVFYDTASKKSGGDLKKILEALEDDGSLRRDATCKIDNSFNFKTCLSIVHTSHEPELKFVRKLIEGGNAKKIQGWVKNHDTSFYQVEYSYSKGDFSKRGQFNPDFFIALDPSKTVVVEIKGDEELKDPSPENRGKRKWAQEHFDRLNDQLKKKQIRYHLTFLTPSDYEMFFASLRDGRAMQYKSQLDAALDG